MARAEVAEQEEGARSAAEAENLLTLEPDDKPRNNEPVGGGLVTKYLEAEVVVAGGGSAGTNAALASCRSGAKTILVQSRGVLGGNASSESKLHMVGADLHGVRGRHRATETREGGIVEEYTLMNAVKNGQRSHSMHDLFLYDYFRTSGPNCQLLLNTWVVGATKTPAKTVTEIIAENQETQIRYLIKGKVFIDATGDGRLGAEAEVPHIIGRESSHQYNESLALPKEDGETMGSSLAFVAREHPHKMPFTPPSWAIRYTKEDFRYRGINDLEYGYWWIEVAWPFHTIHENEEIRDKLMEVVMGVWDYIKNSGNYPEADNLAIEWLEWWPCKRQGRLFQGQYVMTQHDILPDVDKSRPPALFWDRVSHGGWNIDLHAVKGVLDTSVPAFVGHRLPYIYSTPLRSLVALNATNLMFAGRLASFSHVVFGSQRVMKTCAAMGQATGTAAAYCALHDVQPHQLADDKDAVWSIQQQLLRDDQYIIGMYNEDPRDYARRAHIYASSENASGIAKEVISGQNRAVHGYLGAAPGQRLDGVNRWISKSVPAWLVLEWDQPIRNLSLIELVFDTGMHRELTLSLHKGRWEKMVWGEPQPETVSHYNLQVLLAGTDGDSPSHTLDEWHTVAEIRDNYQRKRVHDVRHALAKVDPKGEGVKAVRIMVLATNGAHEALIFEVRVYDHDGIHKFPSKKPSHEGRSERDTPVAFLSAQDNGVDR
ncbi:unnamed protein product [Vitrella brassicaformis CCMP3155]|uniref:Uncharacterized protein n=2 Tax=Vitrella brassicaformis TaxID=1169539 RepID=A0A0G4ECL5_VITBC|nr:unnamed protein product [Vitrella brassicaformis CCMP3155]|eukprot:CEL93046.1 unnamed protein product [Vitrella brassicaformis CCMP3155]